MSILIAVERKSTKGRLFLTGVFIALVLGGITMVYPFLLMFSGAIRSDMDIAEMDIIPDYLTENKVLVKKFLETKYNYDVLAMNRLKESASYSFKETNIPEKISQPMVEDYNSFMNSGLPLHWQILGGIEIHKKITSEIYGRFKESVKKKYNGDLNKLSKDLGSPLRSWNSLNAKTPKWTNARYDYSPTKFFNVYSKMVFDEPPAVRTPISLTGAFLQEVIYPKYGASETERYNSIHKINIKNYDNLYLSKRIPEKQYPKIREDWLTFVFDAVHISYVKADVTDSEYAVFIQNRYKNIQKLQEQWRNADIKSFADIKLPSSKTWIHSNIKRDYKAFLEQVDVEKLYLVGPEFEWQKTMKDKYASIDALNNKYGENYTKWEQCRIPTAMAECQYVYENTGKLRWRYATRNFRVVFDFVLFQGRPMVNSLIYVTLALLFSLTLQPLVAYALSRFNPPGTWKFIMIFMATMAFPPMVAFIPQFLILKQLNILNTFIALVLPVTINGYLIFLLKGFFDSIPDNLYEAATIDGASEMRMFWVITMALSKPILAVVALNTFRMAWMAFMYPLIVCPNEDMHVLAVWVHQFQQHAPTSAVFASILVASIPTLLIFMFAQRTIMKGIAVPSEK
ncbi:MAG: carbohydrate ABC transporter permease [Verrucomicrobiota bacterium]|nr:carbohydrate ABC transporter permease [Verrucomicrobiota bacterium]